MKESIRKNLGVFDASEMGAVMDTTVVIVGLGGLGGMAANGLVRMGVKRLVLIDHDRFEETNLNRQLFCTRETLGMKKVYVAEEALHAIDPDCDIKVYADRFETLMPSVFEHSDIILDALDSIPLKLQLERIASRHGKPLVHGAVGGWYGQVGISMPASRMLEKYYRSKEEGAEAEEGSPTFTPGVIANLMVLETAKLLAGREEALRDSLLFFDLLTHELRTVTLGDLE